MDYKVIRRLASRQFLRIADLSDRISRKLQPPDRSVEATRAAPWFDTDGDRTLRLDYPLTSSSIVLDVGGFEGQWASDIIGRFCCTVHVFEPVPEYVRKLKWRFAPNPLVHVHAFGLAAETKLLDMSIDQDRSSGFKGGEQIMKLELVDIEEFLTQAKISEVDLLKINIEGGEYELLERLIQSGSVRTIKDIQVQFHDFVPDAEPRMRRIQESLTATHELTYEYPFVWENWRRKSTA